jgi:hypothetical protein
VSPRLTEGARSGSPWKSPSASFAFAVVTEPVTDTPARRRALRDEALVGLLPADLDLGVPSWFLAALSRNTADPPPVGEPAATTRSTRRCRRTLVATCSDRRSRASG